MKSFSNKWLLAVFLVAMIIFSAGEAFAVRVSIQRVVFEGKQRTETLTIINNTPNEQTYRLGWRKYRMSEDKSLKAIEEGEPSDDILWAEDMVRFAPRRVTIPSGGSQQIRLLLRRPADIQEAEYRAHLWIVMEAAPKKFELNKEKGAQAVLLAVQPAVSLPVFVRNGNLQSDVSLSDVELMKEAENLKISFTINREGNRSLYGDLDFVCTDGDTPTVLRQVRGISVYTEIEKRHMEYELPLGSETVENCNSVNILYRASPSDIQYQGEQMAEATATLK